MRFGGGSGEGGPGGGRPGKRWGRSGKMWEAVRVGVKISRFVPSPDPLFVLFFKFPMSFVELWWSQRVFMPEAAGNQKILREPKRVL